MKLIYFEGEPQRYQRLRDTRYWLLVNQEILEYYIESLEDWKGTLIVKWKHDMIIEPLHLALVECAWNLQGEDQIKHYQGANSIDCILK